MLLGFKRRFAPFVLDGTKTHTIRGIRRIPPRVGEICHCYVDPRQKTMQLLGRFPCVKVEEFFLDARPNRGGTYIDMRLSGMPLNWDEKVMLAYRDGFGREADMRGLALVEMMAFWRGRLPFLGQIIHWRHS